MQSSHPRLQPLKAVKPDVQKNLAPSFDRAVKAGKAGPVSFGLHSQKVLYNHGVEWDCSNIFLHLFTLKRQDPHRFQWTMLTHSPLMSWRCLPQNLLRHARSLLMTFQPREENIKGVRILRVQRPKSWVNTEVLHPAHVPQHLREPHPQRTCLHQKWLLLMLPLDSEPKPSKSKRRRTKKRSTSIANSKSTIDFSESMATPSQSPDEVVDVKALASRAGVH